MYLYKYRYMMYDIWIYELVFCATCCVVVRWQEAPNTICTALHHFSARSKCSSRPNSHQKVLKRNRQKPEKKYSVVIFIYFQQSLKQKSPCQLHTTCVFFHLAGWHIFSAFSTEDSCRKPAGSVPAQQSARWKNDRNVWKSCGKSKRKLVPQKLTGLHGLDSDWTWVKMKNQIRTFFNSWLRLFHLEKVFRSVWQSAELQWYNAIKIQVQPFLLSLSKAYGYTV